MSLKLLFISLNELNEVGSFNTKCKVRMPHISDFLQILWTNSVCHIFSWCLFPKKETGNDRDNLFNTTLAKSNQVQK